MALPSEDYWLVVCSKERLAQEIASIKAMRAEIKKCPRGERRQAMERANALLRLRQRQLQQFRRAET